MSPKHKPMEFKVEDIDPEHAEVLLAHDAKDRQRPLSLTKIAHYAQLMRDGEWKPTPEPIMLDWNDQLINGQHRLRAIIEAGVTVTMTVCYGCDPAIFDVIDQGKPRTSSDLFVISYKKRFNAAPAYSHKVTAIASGMIQRLADHTPERRVAAQFAMEHYKLITEILPVGISKEAGSARAAAAFGNAILYFGRPKVMPLVDRFASGMWASPSDPMKTLFERLVRAKIAEDRKHLLTKSEGYGLGVHAIRLALAGANAKKIQSSSRDFGDADEDKKIKAGHKVRVSEPKHPVEAEVPVGPETTETEDGGEVTS